MPTTLAVEFVKLLKQTNVGETFQYKGETYIVLPNRHYQKISKGGIKKVSKRKTSKRRNGRNGRNGKNKTQKRKSSKKSKK